MWLRSEAVNILRYLPDFIAKDAGFNAVGECLSAEHERQRLAVQDIFNQFFIQTATWGLTKWEELLEIYPKPAATYEERRRSIMLRLQAAQVSTKEFMERLVRRYTTDRQVMIQEHNNECYFDIIMDGVILDKLGLLEALDIYSPAHLGYKFLFRIMDEFVEKLEASESFRASMKLVFRDIAPYNYRKHDGQYRYGRRMVHNGEFPHDGRLHHDTADLASIRHDSDTSDILGRLALSMLGYTESNQVGISHNGAIRYDGAYGHKPAEGGLDKGGKLQIRRGIYHNGKHQHNVGQYMAHDGQLQHDGTHNHHSGMRFHRMQETEEAI